MVPTSAEEIESYVAETARILGIRMDAADQAVVVSLFGLLARKAEALMAHELSETIDAGAIFHMPRERDG
jgi:hypothetical protein